MDNLEIYNKVKSVPDAALKTFDNGRFKGTDINPMWRIKTLTEIFGPCGKGWKYTIDENWTVPGINGSLMVFCKISLYYKDADNWSEPIPGTGGNMLIETFKTGQKNNDEGYKMALTDAISVAAKSLGVGGDVYFAKDITKYSTNETDKPKQEDPDLIIAVDEAKRAKTVEELQTVWNNWKGYQSDMMFKNTVLTLKKTLANGK